MGGGAMLPPLARAAAAAAATTTNLHHPSHLNLPVSAPFWPTGTKPPYIGETSTRFDFLDGIEEKRSIGSYNCDSVFGPVPSRNEVEKAFSDLQSFMHGYHTSELEWLQQMLCLYNPRVLQSMGYGRVDDAFHLLQTDPSVQVPPFTRSVCSSVLEAFVKRLVISISSDKAVWDAILNNNSVQNLRLSLSTAKEERLQVSSEEPRDLATLIVNWILDITKAKVLGLVGKFSSLVNLILQYPEKKEQGAEITDQVDEKIRSSLLLSIVILLIVVVTRAHGISS